MGRQAGEVLAEAYERFGGDLYRYLLLLLGRREHAEDVMQELLMRLMRPAKRDPAALQNRAYVFRAARNEAYRAMGRLRRVPASSSDRVLDMRDPRGGSEEERVIMQEALLRLPGEQREVAHLKVYMNMTYEEIGRLMDTPPDTAASRYRYALEKLRALLAEKEDKP